MIPYNDLDFAIGRWRARAGGAPQSVQPASGAVESEVPVANAPESASVSEETPESASGLIVIQSTDQGADEPDQSFDPDQK